MIRVFTTTPVSRAQALAADVEKLISDRGLQSGERIATMDELRERTRLGRQTISEAARLLAERGLVEVRPGRGGGLFVAQTSPVVRLRSTLLTVPSGSATVADAIALREALEELIDTDAARHRTEADAKDLRRILARMRRSATSIKRYLPVNWALHERIAEITPNEMASAVYVGALRCISGLSTDSASSRDDEAEYLAHRVAVHSELVEAIVAGDVERTVEAVRAHRGLLASG
jgi:GntR family transcriptional regulator, transcriptional repressor for pyruvate dehydrogenase complex